VRIVETAAVFSGKMRLGAVRVLSVPDDSPSVDVERGVREREVNAD